MKKLFTFGLGALMCAGALAAEPSITVFDDQMYYGGFFPECISANGRYVCGSTFAWAGFVSEWQQQNYRVFTESEGSVFEDQGCDLPFINNSGVAVGFDDLGGILVDFPNKKITRPRFANRNIGLADILPAQMTEDGGIIVGLGYYSERKYSEYGNEHYIDYQAAYWEDGESHFLPVPAEEELGYYYLGTRANCISADGSVIMGCIVDRMYTNPLIMWYRQEDGTYKLDPVCEKYFYDTKYSADSGNPYCTFSGRAMSNDGSKVAMLLRTDTEHSTIVALYETATGKITPTVNPSDSGIDPDSAFDFFWTGISNDGTMVGWVNNGITSFIVYPDDMTIRTLASVFHNIGELADFDDIGTNKVSAISPDGSYICGVGWTENAATGWYVGYVLTTGVEPSDNAVEAIEAPGMEGEPEYFTVSGLRLDSPVKGVNIVRYPDGTTRKEVR